MGFRLPSRASSKFETGKCCLVEIQPFKRRTQAVIGPVRRAASSGLDRASMELNGDKATWALSQRDMSKFFVSAPNLHNPKVSGEM